ncbi:MAG: hypothetical protein ACKOPO_15010 [Novosphingobium sp.]
MTSSAPARPLSVPAARRDAVLALLLALIAALPPLLARYPQMADYPAHLARWHVMRDLADNPVLQQAYQFRWAWSGNLGVDLLIQPLAALFGLEAAGRIVVIALPMLVVLGIFAVERALGRRPGVGTFLAMMTVWSPALLLGFVNFTLSVVLALFAFALWVKGDGSCWRAWVMVPLSVAVWLCHLSGWGLLGVMVFGHELANRGNPLRAAIATWPLWLPLALTLLTIKPSPAGSGWGSSVVLVKIHFWTMALRDQWQPLDIACVALLIAAPFVALGRGRIDLRLGWAAAGLALLATFMPRYLGGGDYADYRLTTLALMLGALAVNWRPRWPVMALALVPFLIRIALTTQFWTAGSQEASAVIAGLDRLPQGARLAVAVRAEDLGWTPLHDSHVGAYATVRRDALTNANFAVPGVHMLSLRADAGAKSDPSQIINVEPGERVDLSRFAPVRDAQFLLYQGSLPPSALPRGAQVMHRTAGSMLLRLAKAPPSR